MFLDSCRGRWVTTACFWGIWTALTAIVPHTTMVRLFGGTLSILLPHWLHVAVWMTIGLVMTCMIFHSDYLLDVGEDNSVIVFILGVQTVMAGIFALVGVEASLAAWAFLGLLFGLTYPPIAADNGNPYGGRRVTLGETLEIGFGLGTLVVLGPSLFSGFSLAVFYMVAFNVGVIIGYGLLE